MIKTKARTSARASRTLFCCKTILYSGGPSRASIHGTRAQPVCNPLWRSPISARHRCCGTPHGVRGYALPLVTLGGLLNLRIVEEPVACRGRSIPQPQIPRERRVCNAYFGCCVGVESSNLSRDSAACLPSRQKKSRPQNA